MTYHPIRYLVANSNRLALLNGPICPNGQTNQHHYPPPLFGMADEYWRRPRWYFLLCCDAKSAKAGEVEIESERKKTKKTERRFFHSFPAKLPDSRCLHSAAADLKFVTSCGQNWFPARIPFEQRGPLWRTSCPRLSDRTGKKAVAVWLKAALRRSYPEFFLFFLFIIISFFYSGVSAALHANFLTIQASPWNRAMQTDRWLIRSAWTSRGKPVLACSLPEEMSKAGSHKAVCVRRS